MDDRQAVARLGGVFFDSYFVVDQERRIVTFNQGFVQLLGLRPAAKRGLMNARCYEHLKLSICRERCVALECLKRNAQVRMEEITGTTSQGRELVLELSAVPLRDDADAVVGVLVTHRDVTDERRLKDRYLKEAAEHEREREALLRIIKDRDAALDSLKDRLKMLER